MILPGQGCSAALQDAAALAACLREAGDPDLASALARYSERRAADGWALADLIELQSAAEVRAGALLQGPVVMGFFLEQLGRGTLRPLAELGSRFLDTQLRRNREARVRSGRIIREFLEAVRPPWEPPQDGRDGSRVQVTPSTLGLLHERLVFRFWKTVFGALKSVSPPLNTAHTTKTIHTIYIYYRYNIVLN